MYDQQITPPDSQPSYHGCRTARELWNQLEPNKAEALRRAERAASLTIPGLFMLQGQNTDKDAAGRLWQSIGALLVNNLVTRLMMTLFAPSRPFIRLDASGEVEKGAEARGVTSSDLRQILALAERKTTRSLDKHALRPKLHLLLKHLVVVGNVLAILDQKNKLIRALSLRYYCVKRDVAGKVLSAVIRERVCQDELPMAMQGTTNEKEVDYFILVHRKASTEKFEVTHWVNETLIPDMTRRWSEADCPYRVLAWDVSDEANYGTSQVSDFEGDFMAAEDCSKALIVAAVLASEFRWILDPASGMDVAEFEGTPNGGVMPGRPEHVQLINAAREVAGAIEAQRAVLTDVTNRLGRAFVMTSAVMRDAERVTAEEVRQVATELETGLGGGYSRLAVDLQLPLAKFLMALEDVDPTGYGEGDDKIEITVVTGLDALSRNGDLENLKAWVGDIMQLASAPEEITDPLKLRDLYNDLASPRGIDASKYLESEEELAAKKENRARQAAAARGVQIGEPQQ
jgi:hypothetical protein